jgi:rod shape determining protein RodA
VANPETKTRGVQASCGTQWGVYFRRHWTYLTAGRGRVDWINPAVIVVLSILGLAFIYSVQSKGINVKWKAQTFWVFLGLLGYYATASTHYKIYLQWGHAFYVVAVVLLLLLWTPLGTRMGGSLRWLKFGPLYFQPSDAGKLAVLIVTASILARNPVHAPAHSLGVLLKIALLCALPCTLIFLQPDLGSSLVFPPIVFGLLFASRLSLKFFFSVCVATLVAVALVACDVYAYHCVRSKNPSRVRWKPFLPMKDYQRNRILAFAAPGVVDPRGVHIGWHLKQSLIAVGSGGFWGKGWTKNTQAQLGYLPKAASFNDFIFSVAAEEVGFVGTTFIIFLYGLLIVNSLRIAGISRDRFGCYLAVGVSLLILTHVWINVGMTIGLMPITGIPLPFMSYGGSFMVVCFFALGIVQSVHRFKQAPS